MTRRTGPGRPTANRPRWAKPHRWATAATVTRAGSARRRLSRARSSRTGLQVGHRGADRRAGGSPPAATARSCRRSGPGRATVNARSGSSWIASTARRMARGGPAAACSGQLVVIAVRHAQQQPAEHTAAQLLGDQRLVDQALVVVQLVAQQPDQPAPALPGSLGERHGRRQVDRSLDRVTEQSGEFLLEGVPLDLDGQLGRVGVVLGVDRARRAGRRLPVAGVATISWPACRARIRPLVGMLTWYASSSATSDRHGGREGQVTDGQRSELDQLRRRAGSRPRPPAYRATRGSRTDLAPNAPDRCPCW